MAYLIKASGEKIQTSPRNKKNFTLEELQAYVGGRIQIVKTKDDKRLMVINEEGKLFKLAPNFRATELYEYGCDDMVVGDVLLISKSQII